MNKYKWVCLNCGSDDILVDAYAQFNVASQAWELVEAFPEQDNAMCRKCNQETKLESVINE